MLTPTRSELKFAWTFLAQHPKKCSLATVWLWGTAYCSWNQWFSRWGGVLVFFSLWILPKWCLSILCHCLSLHPISLGKEKGYRLVLHVSKGTQDFTHSLILENWGLSKYLEALFWNAKTEQQDFLASGAGTGKFGWLVIIYWELILREYMQRLRAPCHLHRTRP